MAKKSNLTARGSERLTTEQRSRIMRLAWAVRRRKGEAPPKKPKRTPDKVRRAAMLESWERRRSEGKVPPKQPKVLLTHEQRSRIAKRAAKRRLAGEAARQAEDRKLLNLPEDAVRAAVTKAFKRERRRLGLSPKALRPAIRAALLAELAAARKRKRKARRRTHSPDAGLTLAI